MRRAVLFLSLFLLSCAQPQGDIVERLKPGCAGRVWTGVGCQDEDEANRLTERREIMEGYVERTIQVQLSEVIDHDLEGFLDLISERAGYPSLMDIKYEVLGNKGDTLVIRVTGEDGEDDY